MMRRHEVLRLVAATLLLAACGGEVRELATGSGGSPSASSSTGSGGAGRCVLGSSPIGDCVLQ